MSDVSQCVLNGLGTTGLMESAGALGREYPLSQDLIMVSIISSNPHYPPPQPMDRSTIPGSLFTQILIHSFSHSRIYQLPNAIHK